MENEKKAKKPPQTPTPPHQNPTPKPEFSKTEKFPLSLILISNLNTWLLHKLASLSSLCISYRKCIDYIAHSRQKKPRGPQVWCRSHISVPVTYKPSYYVTSKNNSHICTPNIYMSVAYEDNFTGIQTSIGIKQLKPAVFKIENAFQMNLKVFIFGNIQLSHSN